jgi:hypothetical protein
VEKVETNPLKMRGNAQANQSNPMALEKNLGGFAK